ncbi:hypothetical protein [Bacillus sp. FJAT-29814]|uniref:hypothetical protein n=1 Tax=Bacillus sp. FJAT-29814 TaxID=1729688 RepID=UPI00082BFBF2|nr:hypothetical protein [Bacillus sp. FJAT-29814]
MKLIFSLLVISLSISLLLIQSHSFTTAEISSEAILTVVPEENALIAITYGKNKRLVVTNNTGNTIEIESIEWLGSPNYRIIEVGKNDANFIMPGTIKEFTLTGDPKQLSGGVIKINVRWNGGSAELTSTIPELIKET